MEHNLSYELLECLEHIKEGYDVLHLNYQGLTELPEELFSHVGHRHVTRIHAKRNRLKSLPDVIGNFTKLTELYLHSNNLDSLPMSISKLVNLQSLDLSNNNFSELPESVCELESLEVLAVSNNGLQTLPKGLSKLNNLRVLDLINNKLSALPIELANCCGLQRLLVDRNKLFWLPRQLCHMKQLEELSAAGNEILCLPLDLGTCPTLKNMFVDSNKVLHAIPLSVQSQEIGFNSCGSTNYSPRNHHKNHLQKVRIIHNTDVVKDIYLPPEIMTVNTPEDRVPTLLELASRIAYTHFKDLEHSDLPINLHSILDGPTASCSACEAPVFSSGFPVVFEGRIRVYSLYYLGLCCSWACVKRSSLVIQLPLVYPNISDMSMALALVQ